MRFFSSLLFVLLISFSVSSQSRADSLKQLLASLPPQTGSFSTDTTRIRVLCELGSAIRESTEAHNYLKEAMALSTRINWKKGRGLVKNVEGRLLTEDNFYYQAIDKFNETIKIGHEINDKEIIRTAHRYLGAAYYMLGDDETAILHYEKALEGLREISLRRYCTLKSNIGLCYIRMKQYGMARAVYDEVIKLYKPVNDSLPLSWFYSNLGTAQRGEGMFSESIKSFDLSLAHTPKDPVSERAFTTSEKALSLYKSGDLDQAVQLAKQAEIWAEKATNFEKVYILENLYTILKAKGDIKNALEAYENCMELKNQNDEDMKKRSIEGLKTYYENQQKEVEIAQEKSKNRYLLYGLLGLLFTLIIIFRSYYLVRIKNKKIELQKTEISHINQELADLNDTLESKVIERTEELNKANNELIKKNFEITEALFRGQTMERKRVAAELHDNLGSTLAALKWRLEALNDDVLNTKEKAIYKSIKETMNNAYYDVRNISQNLMPKDLEQHGLVKALSNFIDSLNTHQKIAFRISTTKDRFPASPQIEFEIYNIVKELITNTLKHSTASEASLFFTQTKDGLYVHYETNAKPISVPQTANSLSQGIKNLKERVSVLNGKLAMDNFSDIEFSIPI